MSHQGDRIGAAGDTAHGTADRADRTGVVDTAARLDARTAGLDDLPPFVRLDVAVAAEKVAHDGAVRPEELRVGVDRGGAVLRDVEDHLLLHRLRREHVRVPRLLVQVRDVPLHAVLEGADARLDGGHVGTAGWVLREEEVVADNVHHLRVPVSVRAVPHVGRVPVAHQYRQLPRRPPQPPRHGHDVVVQVL
eukprot:gene12023-biopygen6838